MEQDELVGLAFPVIRVRYVGPTDYTGSHYAATIRGIRHSEPYDPELSSSRNAYNAAAAAWSKYYNGRRWDEIGDGEPRVFIPGDLTADAYAYTVIPVAYVASMAIAGTALGKAAMEAVEGCLQ